MQIQYKLDLTISHFLGRINYRNIINSIGNYYHPRNVFISKNIINLIPKREYNAGFAEVIKSGFIQKNSILNLLKLNKKKLLNRNFKNITKIIKTTLNTKINFFKNDIYENSKRLYLNFGHTFAHAIEMSLKKDGNEIIRHGEAVGIGMLCEIYYSSGKNENFFKLQNLLISYNLPININKFINLKKKQIIKKKIFKNIFLDKKRINKYPRCIKLEKIGKTKIIELRNNDKIFETINNVIFND